MTNNKKKNVLFDISTTNIQKFTKKNVNHIKKECTL
jgi:hypothetical protein